MAALVNGGAALDERSERSGSTPLMAAAAAGHLAAVKTLVKAGADVNAACPRRGNTALHYVALLGPSQAEEWKLVSIARELLLAGCEPGAVNLRGETALALADKTGAQRLKQLLVEASGATYIGGLGSWMGRAWGRRGGAQCATVPLQQVADTSLLDSASAPLLAGRQHQLPGLQKILDCSPPSCTHVAAI